MATTQRISDSILTIDIGSVWTRVLLLDRVEGSHRFVAQGDAPTTIAPPHSDLLTGIRNAIHQVEERSGRQFLDKAGNVITPEDKDGHGVDLVICSISALEPLKVATGALTEGVSAASARRAAYGTYSEMAHSFALDATPGRWGKPTGAVGVAQQLVEEWPDILLLAGGTEQGSADEMLELVDAVGLALAADPKRDAPSIIWAGSGERTDQVRARLGENTPLLISENIRPTLETERLHATRHMLSQELRSRRLSRIANVKGLQNWCSDELVPSSEAFTRVIQYLALSRGQRVLGVDAGGSSIVLSVALPDGFIQVLVRSDLGLSSNSEKLLEIAGADALLGWVPGSSLSELLLNEWLNLGLNPIQQPMSSDALDLLQAATREAIHATCRDAFAAWDQQYPNLTPPFDLILATGGAIREAPRAAQVVAMLLDSIQPAGITHLMRDRVGLATSLGALAAAAPYAAASLVETQGFESLGVMIAPLGSAEVGEEILHFRLTQEDDVTEGNVEFGQIYRFPTPIHTELELKPLRGFDIGYGPNIGTTLTRERDSVGFVIDARGRPLPIPDTLEERRARAEEWMRYVGA